MDINPEEIAERIGRSPHAEFEVMRGTDTETVEADPESVAYGAHAVDVDHYGSVAFYRSIPMVVFEFNKYHSGLPPWDTTLGFTLYGDDIGEFLVTEHHETNITGNLKTVHMSAETVEFRKNEYQVK